MLAPCCGHFFGLTEAPRGALGHWLKIVNSKIGKYQVVTQPAGTLPPGMDRQARTHRDGPDRNAGAGHAQQPRWYG